MQYTPPRPESPWHELTTGLGRKLQFTMEHGSLCLKISGGTAYGDSFIIPPVMIGILEQCIAPDSENLRLLRRSLGDLMKSTVVLKDGKTLDWSQVISAGDLEGFDPNELDNQDKPGKSDECCQPSGFNLSPFPAH